MLSQYFKTQRSFITAAVFIFALAVGLVGIFSVPRQVVAGTSSEGDFTISPSSTGHDDLIGATSTDWVFTVTTTEDLVSGDVVRFGFPFINYGYSAFLTQSPTASVTELYTSMGVVGTNLQVNPSFETSVTGTGWYSGSMGTHEISATTTAYRDNSAVYIMGGAYDEGTSAYNLAILSSTSTVSTGTPFAFSFYGKTVEAGSGVFVGFEAGACEGGGNFYRYNFTTESWDCGDSAPEHLKTVSLTDSFARYVVTTTSHVTSTLLKISFTVAKVAPEGSESVILDAIQLEEGSSATTYNEGDVLPESGVVGRPQTSSTGAIVYGFVTSTIPSGTNFSVTIGGITNPTKEFSTLNNLGFSLVMGTPTTSTEPWGTMSSTKFSQSALGSLVRNQNMPGTISNLLATASTSAQINLSWGADASSSYYIIYSTTTAGFGGAFSAADRLATTTALTYSATGLTESTTYHFAVAGYNTIGEGPNSATSTTSTLASVTIPGAPSGLGAVAASISQINLSWTAVSGADYYKIYRSTDSYATAIATTTGVSYSNTGLSGGTAYSYKVSAVNTAGEGEKSSIASATTQSGSNGGGGGWSDTTPPTNVSVLISGGATTTASVAVTLTLGATDASQMMIANDSAFTGFDWMTFSTSRLWNLTAGNGTKTVYAKFKDGSGNVSALVSDTIILSSTTTSPLTSTTTPSSELSAPVVVKVFSLNLKIGSKGEDVRRLQQFLKDSGYMKNGKVTAIFNAVTKKALMAYQKANKIKVTGTLDDATRAKINGKVVKNTKVVDSAITPVVAQKYQFTKLLNIGSVGDEVRNLQQVLKDLGYFEGNVTSYFGSVTRAAVIKFQQDRKLAPAPGWVGPGTRDALNAL